MFSQPTPLTLSARQFDYIGVIHGLDIDKSITQQKEARTSYEEKGRKIPVEINHGVVLIFRTTDHHNFVLGKMRTNPAGDHPIELQASLGDLGDGLTKIDSFKPIKNTLQNNIDQETNKGWDLSHFELSSDYVCHRVKEWNVCYLKMVALCKIAFSDTELKHKLNQINVGLSSGNKYGLYALNEVINAAKLTIGLPEGSHKPKSILFNHLTNTKASMVIFDDYAIATLFTNRSMEALFPQSLERKAGLITR